MILTPIQILELEKFPGVTVAAIRFTRLQSNLEGFYSFKVTQIKPGNRNTQQEPRGEIHKTDTTENRNRR